MSARAVRTARAIAEKPRRSGLLQKLERLLGAAKPDAELAAAKWVADMDALQDEVESSHDAFLLDPGMGPMLYLTTDGRVLVDERAWDGDNVREATDDEATAALVAGAANTSIAALLDLIPAKPDGAVDCAMCSATRWLDIGPHHLICGHCHGRGWVARAT